MGDLIGRHRAMALVMSVQVFSSLKSDAVTGATTAAVTDSDAGNSSMSDGGDALWYSSYGNQYHALSIYKNLASECIHLFIV